MDWSHDLLSVEEQTLLRRLAVFHGGFTLEAAEAICSDESLDRNVILDLVGRLVDTSLLVVRGGEEPARYGMLETVRHYALERLDGTAEAASLQRRHARYYAARAALTEDDLFSEKRAEHYKQLALEQADLHAGLVSALDRGEADLLIRMTGDLGLYWFVNNRFDEALYWLPRVLEITSSEPTLQRAKALYALGLAYVGGSWQEAEVVAGELADIANALGDPEPAGEALFIQKERAFHVGDLVEARRLGREQVRLLRDVDRPLTSLALVSTALISVMLGDLIGASRLADEAEDRAAKSARR